MHKNSLKTYMKLKNNVLARLQREVFYYICKARSHRLTTCRGISDKYGFYINSVSGRITELKNKGMIKQYKTIKINGLPHSCHKATGRIKPLTEWNTTRHDKSFWKAEAKLWKDKYLDLQGET